MSDVGYVADPNELGESSAIQLDPSEKAFVDRLNLPFEDDRNDGDFGPVLNPPRRASLRAPLDEAGPRSRMALVTSDADSLRDEPGIDFYSPRPTGPTGRPEVMSPVARARVIALLEEAANELPIDHMRRLMRRGRRTKAAQEDYERLAYGVAAIRARRNIRVSHLAEVLGCDPATVWRLTIRGQSQLQDSQDLYVGTGAQQLAA